MIGSQWVGSLTATGQVWGPSPMPGEGVIAPFSMGVAFCFWGVAEVPALLVPFPLLLVQAVTNTISPRNIHTLHNDRRIERFFISLYLCSKSTFQKILPEDLLALTTISLNP